MTPAEAGRSSSRPDPALAWRREISEELAEVVLERLLAAPIALAGRRQIASEARRLANRLGWAKTYD